jgi:hypothetical protein
MERLQGNFATDQQGMHQQLAALRQLVQVRGLFAGRGRVEGRGGLRHRRGGGISPKA